MRSCVSTMDAVPSFSRLQVQRKDLRIPIKLRIAEEDATMKPPAVSSSVVRSALAAISTRFPSEISLSDLDAFVQANGLAIPPATLCDMVKKARAKRRDWQAKGRHMPRKVFRDTLWAEDVMWALRVRKNRKEFDKWDVNEHRSEWVSILEAATPDNPTIFAPPVDHRIAPPLSYTELEKSGSVGGFASSGGTASIAVGRSPSMLSSKGGGEGGGLDRRGGSSMSRPVSASKIWASFGSGEPLSSILTPTARPATAAAAALASADCSTLVGWSSRAGAEVSEGPHRVGEDGDATTRLYPQDRRNGGESGNSMSCAWKGSAGIAAFASLSSTQRKGIFGRKPSPSTIARSGYFAPRRRPRTRVDGRLACCDKPSEESLRLQQMEADVNREAGFSPGVAGTVRAYMSTSESVATTKIPWRRGGATDARGPAWGSVASALTLEQEWPPAVAMTDGAAAASGAIRRDHSGRADEDQEVKDGVDDKPGGNIEGAYMSNGGSRKIDNITRADRNCGTVISQRERSDSRGKREKGVESLSESCVTESVPLPVAPNDDKYVVIAATGAAVPTSAHESIAESVACEAWTERNHDNKDNGDKNDRLVPVLHDTPTTPIAGDSSPQHSQNCKDGGVAGVGEVSTVDDRGTRSPTRKEDSAAEWWRDARELGLRPKTRRCAAGEGRRGDEQTSGPIVSSEWGVEGDRGQWRREGVGGGGEGGSWGARPATAPMCGFSADAKQKLLEGCLERRSHMNEVEERASVWVRHGEKMTARAEGGAMFRHTIGRNSIRQNLDRCFRTKARETLALDLRGYGTPLVAPETTSSPRDNGGDLPPTCADGRRPAQKGADPSLVDSWCGQLVETAAGRDNRGRVSTRKERKHFRIERGRSLQDDRVFVAATQAGVWGTCSQAQFGRFGEKPYIHSFRPYTSPSFGLVRRRKRGSNPSDPSMLDFRPFR